MPATSPNSRPISRPRPQFETVNTQPIASYDMPSYEASNVNRTSVSAAQGLSSQHTDFPSHHQNEYMPATFPNSLPISRPRPQFRTANTQPMASYDMSSNESIEGDMNPYPANYAYYDGFHYNTWDVPTTPSPPPMTPPHPNFEHLRRRFHQMAPFPEQTVTAASPNYRDYHGGQYSNAEPRARRSTYDQTGLPETPTSPPMYGLSKLPPITETTEPDESAPESVEEA